MTQDYEELPEGAEAPTTHVEISARTIHEAYEDLKTTLQIECDSECQVVLSYNEVYNSTAEMEANTQSIKAKYATRIAQAEVDRVRALMDFFQIQSILKLPTADL